MFVKHPRRIFDDAFAAVEAGANQAATGANALPLPTDAQAIAGNYRMGRVRVHGVDIRIENVRGSYREGVSPDGTAWRNRLAAHYGYFFGTRGADGDPVDAFVGPFPESEAVWVINQRHVGGKTGFDEHKVMVGFHTEEQARSAYTHSFDPDWRGLESIEACTFDQLKWWLRSGNHKTKFQAANLPSVGDNTMLDKVLWGADAQPMTTTMARLMYGLRVSDADAGLMLDALSVDDLMADPDIEAVPVYDALVVEVASMTRKMELLRKTMEAAGGAVKPLEMTIADPVRSRGVLQVMVLFSMSDGQTVSVWFHNPDTTPAKLTPMDELISWRWCINKKDVTIVVAPERGSELNIREVSRRMMRLVEKNSEAFQKANAKAAERAAATEALKTEIVGLEATLAGLQRKIEVAKVERETTPAAVATPDIDPTTPDGYQKVWGGGGNQALKEKYQDTLDALMTERLIAVLAALRGLGWSDGTPDTGSVNVMRNGASLVTTFEHAGAGRNVVGILYSVRGNVKETSKDNELRDDLSVTPEQLAAELDGFVSAAPKITHSEWMGEIYRAVESEGDMSTSDAQGVVDIQEFILAQEWGKGTAAIDVARKILALAVEPPPVTVNETTEAEQTAFPEPHQRAADIQEFIEAGFKRVADNDYVRVSGAEDKRYQFNIRVTEDGFVIRLTIGFSGGITGASVEVGKTADINAALAMVEDDLAKRAGPAAPDAADPVAAVDAAYKFGNATDAFKEWVADSVSETEYSPFFSAMSMDKKAKELGASVAWDVSHANLDSVALDVEKLALLKATADSIVGGVVLDGANMGCALAELRIALDVVETNAPINEAAGNLDQAALERDCAKSFREAISLLDAAKGEPDADGEDFDPQAEFDAAPESEDDDAQGDAVLDGDFKNHPFRGNQYKKAARASGAAVNASIRAKSAERRGDAKSSSKAHETAHHAHKAALVEATGKAKKYHKIMAAFHGGKAGLALDSAQEEALPFAWMLDDANTEYPGSVIGLITANGEVAGRAHIAGDGKAMVFVGAEGQTRVQYKSDVDGEMRNAMWSDDDAPDMVGWLLTPKAKEPEVVDNDATRLKAADALVSSDAIMSDDPRAIEKLDAKLTALRLRQEFMKKANKFFKKGDDAGLLAMGLTQAQINKMKGGDFAGRIGFPDYMLTNNNGVMAATRKRMEALMKAKQQESAVQEVTEPADQVEEVLPVAQVLPDPAPVVDPTPEPQVVVDPIRAIDTAYLQTFVDGTADLFAADVLDRLEPMFAKYESDAAMMDLLNRAAEAYSDAAVKAAQAALAA